MLWFVQKAAYFLFVFKGSQQWQKLNWLLEGRGQNFNYQDNIEADDWFKCHDTIKFIVKKVNHCCFSGTVLQSFSLRLLGGDCPLAPLVSTIGSQDAWFCRLSDIKAKHKLNRIFINTNAPVIGFPGMGDPGDTGRNRNFLQ